LTERPCAALWLTLGRLLAASYVEQEYKTLFQSNNQGHVTHCITREQELQQNHNFFGPLCQ
jgi:hypothetical protein